MTSEKQPRFDYAVDGEAQSTAEHVLTPTQILQAAGVDPATHYLVEIIGKETKSYENKMSEAIHMHEHMKFVSVATGPTPVSSEE